MNGRHRVVVANNKLHYEFEIKRNITIIQGESATGKTTLVDMIRQNMNLGEDSGIDVICDVPCRVLEGVDWESNLKGLSGNILFIDEGNKFVNTKEFAVAVKASDNYFVIITRENIYNLPYSVEEIYGIHSSGKYKDTRKVYQQTYNIYSHTQEVPVHPEHVIVEDSNAGFEFFSNVCSEHEIKCSSAGGKASIFNCLKQVGGEVVCIVADGAAIGPEMSRLYEMTGVKKNIKLYLPESFEWIILNSGVIKDGEIDTILTSPEMFIDSQAFFSWERYFTKLLIQKTEGSYLQYSKSKLNSVYLHDKNRTAILKSLKGIRF